MKKKIFLLYLLCCWQMHAFTQSYSEKEIPENIKKNANLVIRDYSHEVKVNSLKDIQLKYREVYTALNEEGAKNCRFVFFYTPSIELKSFKGKVIDENGKTVKKYSKDDLIDRSYVQGFSLYEDNRLKLMGKVPSVKYPLTFVYEYEVKWKNTFQIPSFNPVFDWGIGLENASFKLIDNEDVLVSYTPFNLGGNQVKEEIVKGKRILSFSLKNLPALNREQYGKNKRNSFPRIELKAKNYQYEKHEGSFESWETFGSWISSLNNEGNHLGETTTSFINQVKSSSLSKREKVKKIYRYLQSRTRYVSIQLGIGGFKPFDASYVDEHGYGDCKALSNYMVTMLRNADIDSYYTLVYKGDVAPEVSTKDVVNKFNHVFVCVPMEKDTVWLECTSQTLPFDYMDPYNSDRHGLIIDGEKSRLVRIPAFDENASVFVTKAVYKLNADGSVDLDISEKATGRFLYELIWKSQMDEERKKKWLAENYYKSGTQFGESSFGFDNKKASAFITMKHVKWTQKSGDRLFVKRSFSSHRHGVNTITDTKDRKSPIILNHSRTIREVIQLKIPEGYELKALPGKVEIENKIGSLIQRSELIDNELKLVVELKVLKGEYAEREIPAFNKLARKWNKLINSKIILEKKQTKS